MVGRRADRALTQQQIKAANFDRLARVYAFLERVTFGSALARRRSCFLDDSAVAKARSVLVLGDGDGRFTAALVERNPTIEVHAVDASAAMLDVLRRRVARQCPRASVTVHHADARDWLPPPRAYDLVVAHFFFDCFTNADIFRMIGRIVPTLAPNARWLVSEFAVPPRRVSGLAARVVVRVLYFLFWSLTGLSVKTLPDYAGALASAGFACARAEMGLGGMLRSELWQRA